MTYTAGSVIIWSQAMWELVSEVLPETVREENGKKYWFGYEVLIAKRLDELDET